PRARRGRKQVRSGPYAEDAVPCVRERTGKAHFRLRIPGIILGKIWARLPSQNVNFAPSWTRRIVAPVASAVIWPNPAEPNDVFGLAKLARLNTLNASARTCRRMSLPSGMFFISDRSVFL